MAVSTVSEIATYTTDKLGINDSATVDLAKNFIRARFRMIWDSFYWIESKVAETITLHPASTQIVTFTTAIDKIVAIRWNDRRILPVNEETVFQIDPSAFDNEGETVAFARLPKDGSGQPRIKLFEIPQEAREIVALGKAPVPTLADGS